MLKDLHESRSIVVLRNAMASIGDEDTWEDLTRAVAEVANAHDLPPPVAKELRMRFRIIAPGIHPVASGFPFLQGVALGAYAGSEVASEAQCQLIHQSLEATATVLAQDPSVGAAVIAASPPDTSVSEEQTIRYIYWCLAFGLLRSMQEFAVRNPLLVFPTPPPAGS